MLSGPGSRKVNGESGTGGREGVVGVVGIVVGKGGRGGYDIPPTTIVFGGLWGIGEGGMYMSLKMGRGGLLGGGG